MDACVDCFFRVLLLFLPVGGSQSVQCTVHDGSGRHHYYFMPDESSSDLREFFGWRKVSVQSRVDSCNSPNLHATKEFESTARFFYVVLFVWFWFWLPIINHNIIMAILILSTLRLYYYF